MSKSRWIFSTICLLLNVKFLVTSIGASTDVGSESSDVVSIQYRGKHICTGTQLDEDFVLTSVKCVNVTQRSQLEVRKAPNEERKVNKVSTRWGFALLHINPVLKQNRPALTAIERPERGEECEVLSFNEYESKGYYVRIIECGGDLSTKPVICVRGHFKKDPGVILRCRGHISGVFANARIFADISPFNDWIDDVFRTVIDPTVLASDDNVALAAEEEKIIQGFPDLDEISRKKLVCILHYTECYNSNRNSDRPIPAKCKRGFHPYSCEFLLQHYDLGEELPKGREARTYKLEQRAEDLEDGVLKEFWTWVDHHNKQYLGF